MDLQKKVKIYNTGSIDVIVTMGQTDPSHVELPTNTSLILRGGDNFTLDISFDGGCAKMYVWSMAKTMLWCGIVPLTNDIMIPLILNSDSLEVSYAGVKIPQCPETKANHLIEHFEIDAKHDRPTLAMLFLILVLIISVYLLVSWLW